MVKCGSASALRRLVVLAVLAALPACTGGKAAGDPGSAPVDSALPGAALEQGSRAGNYLAGRYAQTHSDFDQASVYLTRALAADPDNVELLQRATLALAIEGKLPEAAQTAKRLLRYDGEATVAAMVVAEQAAHDGNWGAAEAAVSNLPRRGLNSFMAPLITAWARVGQGRIDAALDALQPLSQSSNLAALADFNTALIDDMADRRKAAEQSYRSVLGGNGGVTLRSAQAAASFYRRIGQNERAEEVRSRYRQEHGDTVLLDEMPPRARLVDSAAAGLAETFFGTANSLRQSNAPDLALIFSRLALDMQPDFPLAKVQVADLLQSLGQLREANAYYQELDGSTALATASKLRLASNLDDMGDVEGAIDTLHKLSAAQPKNPEPLLVLGEVLRQHKRWTQAVAAYDQAQPLLGPPDRSQWSFYYSRGIALERAKQWPRAESDFLKALELQPDDPYVLNYLGYSWIEQGVNLDRARAMIEKAVAQRPTDGFIVDSLGWVMFRTGDYQRAVDLLQKAVELHPEDATINDHLGDALWAVGRQEEARFQWRRSLISNPDPEQKAELDRKLQSGLTLAPPLGAAVDAAPAAPPAATPAATPVKAGKKATAK